MRRLPPLARGGIALGAIAVVVAVILLLQRSGDAGTPGGEGPLESRAPSKGETAPDFALQGLDGGTVRLSDLRGKPVLLNFWATWCGPCKEEMPELQAAYDAAGGDLVVLAVNVEGRNAEESRRLAADYRDLNGYTFPIVLDSPAGQVFEQYRLRGLPDSFFIDRDGVVQDVVVGPLTKGSLEQKLSRIR